MCFLSDIDLKYSSGSCLDQSTSLFSVWPSGKVTVPTIRSSTPKRSRRALSRSQALSEIMANFSIKESFRELDGTILAHLKGSLGYNISRQFQETHERLAINRNHSRRPWGLLHFEYVCVRFHRLAFYL